MNQNDLDNLLAEFRLKNPGELRVQKWKNAARSELDKSTGAPAKRFWLQLVAAMVAGFIIGAMYFKRVPTERELLAKNNYSNDATYEFSYTKSE